MQRYLFSVEAGSPAMLNVQGDYIRFLGVEGTDDGAKSISVVAGQNSFVLVPGQAVKLPESVKNWIISTHENVGFTGALMLGTGDFQDSRISGEVSVVDGRETIVRAGRAFSMFMVSNGIDENDSNRTGPEMGIHNPAQSGVDVIIEAVKILRIEKKTDVQEVEPQLLVMMRPDEVFPAGGYKPNSSFASLNSSMAPYSKAYVSKGPTQIQRAKFEASEVIGVGRTEFVYPYVVRQGGTFFFQAWMGGVFEVIFYWREVPTTSLASREYGTPYVDPEILF